MRFLRLGIFTALILCGGCYPTPEGSVVSVFDLIPIPDTFEGTNGTTHATALYVTRNCSKEMLGLDEDQWVYSRYCTNSGFLPSDELYKRIMHHTTERHKKRVYDVVTVTLPNQTNVTYFDVTRYRYFWPNDR
jgi:hypothetical protein